MKMKDVRPYSVWSSCYTKQYYFKHPWVWCKHFWRNLRAAYCRARYGFYPSDVWEFGYWFLDVVPQMLLYLTDNSVGYPGDDQFPTPELWGAHLRSIANLLENARDEVRDEKNEYASAYFNEEDSIFKQQENKIVIKESDIFDKYYKRDLELAREQDIMIEEALKLLAKTPLKRIWD